MNFEIPATPDIEDDNLIINQTRIYNSKFVPNNFKPLSVYCRDDNGIIIGGLTGKTYWNYLDIGFLWVEDIERGKGVAGQIIKLAEDEARHRGCDYSMLDTYEFQALDFYEKQGYEVFGKLEGYCEKYERYYLKKKL